MELLRGSIPLCCLSVDQSRDTVKTFFKSYCYIFLYKIKEKMGNKKTQKQRRAPGTDKKTRSKGIGHTNPNNLLNSDWSKIQKMVDVCFGLIYSPQ